MKQLVISLFIILCFLNSRGQDLQKIDSLKRLLNKSKEDTSKVKLLLALTSEYQDHDVKKAMSYAKEGGQLSNRLNYMAGKLKYSKRMMYLHATLTQHDSAIWYGKQILKIATETKDSLNMGIAYYTLGERYNFKSDYETGIAYSLKGLRIIERLGTSPETRATLNGSMAANYLMIKDYKKSIEFGEKAEMLDRKNKNYKSLASTLTNLGNAYDGLGQEMKALSAYKESLSLCDKYNYPSFVAMNCEGIVEIMDRQNKLDQVKYYAEKGLATAIKIEDNFNIMSCYQNLSVYYLKTNQHAKAKELLFKALDISKTNDYKEARGTILQSLSNVLYAERNYALASQYQREASKIREDIFTESMAQKHANEEVKFETEKKENQIKLQTAEIRQKNILNYFLIAGTTAFLAISILSYRNYKHRQKLQQAKIDELETEKQLTATEAVLKGEEQERTRLAKDLHDGLGGMLSGIKFSLNNMKENLIMTPENAHAFGRSIDMLDSSIKEMRRVAHNMMPEILVKYGLDIALKEYCEEMDRSSMLHVNYQSIGIHQADIPQTTAINIYRIIQELVNNSIKHAQAKNVLVQLHQSEQEKLLAITVEDDGNGFDTNQLKQSEGMGWLNITNRIEFLKGKIDLQSEPSKGTSIMIEINI
ncbi:two-component system NarL family sensor kinase [Pedobacter africanus]|uniref:Signal transduction histidine kinase n=1 Tax=Pedobacter africanus TaxID=151894 RepID=A0ACC6L014_9SPHI|nr:sensor histidine kinase [Pedobacter africanus]MDR6784944.1 signal transduction histidine kinase [Pedobacter africanus]